MFVPSVTVIGRSVPPRIVRHGIAERGRLFLDAARVGRDELGVAHQRHEVVVAERLDGAEAGRRA